MSGSRSFWFFLRRLFLRGREGAIVVEDRAILKRAIDTFVSWYNIHLSEGKNVSLPADDLYSAVCKTLRRSAERSLR